MTVNERLAVAGLASAYDQAAAARDIEKINAVLRQVGLWQDEKGMNWSLNAQNR